MALRENISFKEGFIMKQERKTGKKIMSFLLAFSMVVGFMPETGMTAKADESIVNLQAALDENAVYGPTMLEDGSFEELTNITSGWTHVDNGNANVTASWWNAALYNHNTGQPYAAFYELKNFANGSSGMKGALLEYENEDSTWYSIDGRRLDNEPSKSGIYINNGKKKIVR